jgi:hypothetical protein
MLATAWRDLAGGHVGMVTDAGECLVEVASHCADARFEGPNTGGWRSDWLPDPDAPANWGVWLAWAQRDRGGTPARVINKTLPYELLRWYVWSTLRAGRHTLPPSVLAWWEVEGKNSFRKFLMG